MNNKDKNNLKTEMAGKTPAKTVTAIVPAAGKASRLPGLRGSKEIYPIGSLNKTDGKHHADKPVCLYLLEKLAAAGIKKTLMVIRKEKWDIPQTLENGKCANMEIAYQILELPYGTAYTIDQAYPFVKNDIIAIGFPDILFNADNAYKDILFTLQDSGCDVVLGLFPADKPHKVDMVETDEANNVVDIIIKPQSSTLKNTWGIAVWNPSFTHYLHDYLSRLERNNSGKNNAASETFIGEAIVAAVRSGLTVKAQAVSDTPFIDIGTPEDLARAEIMYS